MILYVLQIDRLYSVCKSQNKANKQVTNILQIYFAITTRDVLRCQLQFLLKVSVVNKQNPSMPYMLKLVDTVVKCC